MYRRQLFANLGKLVLLGFLMWVSILQLIPPLAIPTNQLAYFSAYKAAEHLNVIGCMPVIWMLFLAMTLAQPLLGTLFWVFLLTLVMPLFTWDQWDGRVLPVICVVASLVMLTTLTTQGHSETHPKRTSLF